MTVYIVLFILLLFIAIYNKGIVKSDRQNKFFWGLCIVLALLGGLRYRIGIDTIRYMRNFDLVPGLFDFSSYTISEISQPLWFLINSFFKIFSDEFVIVQLFHSFAVNLLIGRFIIKACNKPLVALFVYYCTSFCNFNFEIMRESLCVAVYINIIYDYTRDQNIKSFSFKCLPLLFIHWFSFIPIFITIVSHFISKNQVLLCAIVISLFSLLFINEANIGQISAMSEILLGEGDSVDRINQYLNSDFHGLIQVSLLGFAFIFISQILPPVMLSQRKEIPPAFSKVMIIYACFVVIRIKLLIASRFLNYWDLIFLVYLINFVFVSKSNARKYFIVVLLYMTINGISAFLTPLSDDDSEYDCRYVPYASYFDKSTNQQRESYYRWKGLYY